MRVHFPCVACFEVAFCFICCKGRMHKGQTLVSKYVTLMFTFVVLDKNHIANLNCHFFWCVQKGKLVLGIVHFRGVVLGFGGEKI